jgi:hypothetical protein
VNKQLVRVGLIVLIGAIAIAGAVSLRKNHKRVNAATSDLAIVLAADSKGAITQDKNGVTRGYDRAGKVLWTRPLVIIKDQNGNPTARSTNFFCAGDCPNAYGNSAGLGQNRILRYGFGSSGAGTLLGPPLNATNLVLRGMIDVNTMVIRQPTSNNNFEYVFLTAPTASSKSQQLSTPVKIGPRATVSPLVSDDKSRVAAVENTNTGKLGSTTLRWYQRSGSKWKTVGKPLTAAGAGACFSGDGNRAALAGKTTVLTNFGATTSISLPIVGKQLSCSFSSSGVTFSFADPQDVQKLRVVHFNNAGKQIWQNDYFNGGSFNSRQGTSELFQIAVREGTLLLNADTGATVADSKGQPAAYPAGGNNFVTADTTGKPSWQNR